MLEWARELGIHLKLLSVFLCTIACSMLLLPGDVHSKFRPTNTSRPYSPPEREMVYEPCKPISFLLPSISKEEQVDHSCLIRRDANSPQAFREGRDLGASDAPA